MEIKGKFTTIQSSFSQARRIPRAGKIRLGLKKMNTKGVSYPAETPYFVCPPEVQEVYGPQPTKLDVMLIHEDPEVVFPQKLARYGLSKGLVCHGNGMEAERLNPTTRQWEPRACPCEFRKTMENPKGDCMETAHLMVMLPRVDCGGLYQITTRSYNSTVDINSSLEYIRALVGRISMVPLVLVRRPIETHHDQKKQTHYTLSLRLEANIEGINRLREDTGSILENARFQIEGPIEENPILDEVDVITDEDEREAEPEPEDPPQKKTASGGPVIPKAQFYGAHKGKPIRGLSDEALEECMNIAAAIVEDPAMEKVAPAHSKVFDLLDTERKRRNDNLDAELANQEA